ncbi:MAG: hypothetical protein OXF27_07475 [Acidobacteria bacterium]|nr:hypothetical protein [Acidobacteriota bacterium]
MSALLHGEVAGAIRKMWGSGAMPPVKLAFEFLVRTAARSGEARGARWDEIDLPARVMTRRPARALLRDPTRQAHEVEARAPDSPVRSGDGD